MKQFSCIKPTSLISFFALILAISCAKQDSQNNMGRSYYLSPTGDDLKTGAKEDPWKTISKLNSIDLAPGDSVYLNGGAEFDGPLLLDSADSGMPGHPVVIVSQGKGKAKILARNGAGIMVSGAHDIVIKNIHLAGSGRKTGNIESGLVVALGSRFISIDSVEIEGFQKSGLLVYNSSDVNIEKVYSHDNGFSGITAGGENKKSDCKNILIRDCLAANNPGDPTNLTNHSGNGIVVGLCSKVLIEYCAATGNGWDMPRIGNGPVGIWAWEADSVTIQHCISYRNKTSKGGEDGGGFDLDGGVTNSVIQYCLSYENEGAGFGIFQYAGASLWKNNIIRFNISENDGLVSTAHAGIYVWNGSKQKDEFSGCLTYNNVIYNTEGAAIRYSPDGEHADFKFYNNVFVGKDELIYGKEKGSTFLGNCWWSAGVVGEEHQQRQEHQQRPQRQPHFNINGIKDFEKWTELTGHEKQNGKTVGLNVMPLFARQGALKVTLPRELSTFIRYKPEVSSPLFSGGVDLTIFGITGGQDFNNKPLPRNGIGVSF